MSDYGERVDDHRDVQWRRPLPGRRACVPSQVAPTSTGVLPEAGLPVDIADGPNPLFHAIEFTQFSPERSEDRKPGPATRLIALIECQISTDDALNDRRGSVEGPVPCDVCEACMKP